MHNYNGADHERIGLVEQEEDHSGAFTHIAHAPAGMLFVVNGSGSLLLLLAACHSS